LKHEYRQISIAFTGECGKRILKTPGHWPKKCATTGSAFVTSGSERCEHLYGLYHVLGGIISPMDGIGPAELEIDSLIERVDSGNVVEIILALSTTMEGDTTNFYIYRKLKGKEVRISTLARGVSIGDELEYTDEVTLGRSLMNRVPFESSLGK